MSYELIANYGLFNVTLVPRDVDESAHEAWWNQVYKTWWHFHGSTYCWQTCSKQPSHHDVVVEGSNSWRFQESDSFYQIVLISLICLGMRFRKLLACRLYFSYEYICDSRFIVLLSVHLYLVYIWLWWDFLISSFTIVFFSNTLGQWEVRWLDLTVTIKSNY